MANNLTKQEKAKIIYLFKQNKYHVKEIANLVKRSEYIVGKVISRYLKNNKIGVPKYEQ